MQKVMFLIGIHNEKCYANSMCDVYSFLNKFLGVRILSQKV